MTMTVKMAYVPKPESVKNLKMTPPCNFNVDMALTSKNQKQQRFWRPQIVKESCF